MKKIVIDARIIATSTGRYVERLLTHLQTVDDKNQYIVLVPTRDFDYWKPTAKNFSRVECDYKNYSLGEQLGLALQLYRLKADLVHFCMPQQPLLYIKPHVTTVHDLILFHTYNSDKNWLVYHFKQLVGRLVFWWVARSSAAILTPSHHTLNAYRRFTGADGAKLHVTYEAAEKADITPTAYDLPHDDYLLYVGSQSDYKNIRRLIEAHQILVQTKPDLGLVLVGALNESARRNKDWVKKSGYKNIVFTGFVSDQELAYLYQHCRAYTFPSLMEGFGLPALEAMAWGAPVISSSATCSLEIYGEAAEYFDPKNVVDMVAAIERVLDNPARRKDLIQRGLNQVKKYSWATMAKQTHKVYLTALERSQ